MAAKSGYALFMVEGQTDEMSLGGVLSRVVAEREGDETRFDIMRTDPLTQRRPSSAAGGAAASSFARNKIRDEVLAYIERQRIAWTDLVRIVYITDTDGVFIPDDLVVQDSSCSHVVYGERDMRSRSPRHICARNHMKSEALLQLAGICELTYKQRSVPFSAYYMSRNLEHALHGRAEGQSTREKVALARSFSKRYARDTRGFLELMDSLCPEGDYGDSWEYISQGVHSLERGSNLAHAFGTRPGA